MEAVSFTIHTFDFLIYPSLAQLCRYMKNIPQRHAGKRKAMAVPPVTCSGTAIHAHYIPLKVLLLALRLSLLLGLLLAESLPSEPAP
jgi:hypothetical protein